MYYQQVEHRTIVRQCFQEKVKKILLILSINKRAPSLYICKELWAEVNDWSFKVKLNGAFEKVSAPIDLLWWSPLIICEVAIIFCVVLEKLLVRFFSHECISGRQNIGPSSDNVLRKKEKKTCWFYQSMKELIRFTFVKNFERNLLIEVLK